MGTSRICTVGLLLVVCQMAVNAEYKCCCCHTDKCPSQNQTLPSSPLCAPIFAVEARDSNLAHNTYIRDQAYPRESISIVGNQPVYEPSSSSSTGAVLRFNGGGYTSPHGQFTEEFEAEAKLRILRTGQMTTLLYIGRRGFGDGYPGCTSNTRGLGLSYEPSKKKIQLSRIEHSATCTVDLADDEQWHKYLVRRVLDKVHLFVDDKLGCTIPLSSPFEEVSNSNVAVAQGLAYNGNEPGTCNFRYIAQGQHESEYLRVRPCLSS